MNLGIDFEMVQGTTKYIECAVYTSNGVTPYDLSAGNIGAIEFGVKYYGQDTILFKKTYPSGGITASAGVITIKLSPSDTANLYGKVQYELRITETAGAGSDIFTPITGYFIINKKTV